MHRVEIFLPLADNEGRRFPRDAYRGVREQLVARFGGVTAFTRAPAEGVVVDGDDAVRDDIVIYEVMTDALDRAWWRGFRAALERDFRQDEILVRATECVRL